MAVYLTCCHLRVSAGARPAAKEVLDSRPYSHRTNNTARPDNKKKKREVSRHSSNPTKTPEEEKREKKERKKYTRREASLRAAKMEYR